MLSSTRSVYHASIDQQSQHCSVHSGLRPEYKLLRKAPLAAQSGAPALTPSLALAACGTSLPFQTCNENHSAGMKACDMAMCWLKHAQCRQSIKQVRTTSAQSVRKQVPAAGCMHEQACVPEQVDRPGITPERCTEVESQVFDLFAQLGATDEQLDFPVLYASARQVWSWQVIIWHTGVIMAMTASQVQLRSSSVGTNS